MLMTLLYRNHFGLAFCHSSQAHTLKRRGPRRTNRKMYGRLMQSYLMRQQLISKIAKLYDWLNLIMFGFQSVVRVVAKAASKWSGRAVNPSKSIALNWSFKQCVSLMSRCAPVPAGSGLVLLNLREILEKCKQECDTSLDNLADALVLSKTSLVDIVGIQTSVVQLINRTATTMLSL